MKERTNERRKTKKCREKEKEGKRDKQEKYREFRKKNLRKKIEKNKERRNEEKDKKMYEKKNTSKIKYVQPSNNKAINKSHSGSLFLFPFLLIFYADVSLNNLYSREGWNDTALKAAPRPYCTSLLWKNVGIHLRMVPDLIVICVFPLWSDGTDILIGLKE